MTPLTVYADLVKRGIRLEYEDGNLAVSPSQLLTDADRESIRTNRAALLQLVGGSPAVSQPEPMPGRPQEGRRGPPGAFPALPLPAVMPADLPGMLEYRCPTSLGPVVITTLPRRPVESISSSGKTTAVTLHPNIPLGADGWRLATENEWHPMAELPRHWLPYLERQRGTVMDPRSRVDYPIVEDVLQDGGEA